MKIINYISKKNGKRELFSSMVDFTLESRGTPYLYDVDLCVDMILYKGVYIEIDEKTHNCRRHYGMNHLEELC